MFYKAVSHHLTGIYLFYINYTSFKVTRVKCYLFVLLAFVLSKLYELNSFYYMVIRLYQRSKWNNIKVGFYARIFQGLLFMAFILLNLILR